MVLLVVGGVAGILNLPITIPRNTFVLHSVYAILNHKYALHLQCIFDILTGVIIMAELCLDCLNKIMGTNDPAKKYLISRSYDLCEECGEWKRVVIKMKIRYMIKDWIIQNTECRGNAKP